MNVDQSLGSCLPHTFPVTLGIYVQSARLRRAGPTGARQGARQVKGQNSFREPRSERTDTRKETRRIMSSGRDNKEACPASKIVSVDIQRAPGTPEPPLTMPGPG